MEFWVNAFQMKWNEQLCHLYSGKRCLSPKHWKVGKPFSELWNAASTSSRYLHAGWPMFPFSERDWVSQLDYISPNRNHNSTWKEEMEASHKAKCPEGNGKTKHDNYSSHGRRLLAFLNLTLQLVFTERRCGVFFLLHKINQWTLTKLGCLRIFPEGNAGRIFKPAVKLSEEPNSFTLLLLRSKGGEEFFRSSNILEAS